VALETEGSNPSVHPFRKPLPFCSERALRLVTASAAFVLVSLFAFCLFPPPSLAKRLRTRKPLRPALGRYRQVSLFRCPFASGGALPVFYHRQAPQPRRCVFFEWMPATKYLALHRKTLIVALHLNEGGRHPTGRCLV
jgi:hypothetical protein